ncbi:hypothetical protein PRUPE_5G068500 [Prunus persica]|uniref:Uncharacterized protein n=1 Tax=Prunus persica TaxID=3760 RepID=M5WST6_PRUPE|nr:hypothetical protein PRUPE_5G068500 [Prunus persica]
MAPLIRVRKTVGVCCCCNNRLPLNDRIRSCAIKLKTRFFTFLFIYLFILQEILKDKFELRTSNRRITILNHFSYKLFIK